MPRRLTAVRVLRPGEHRLCSLVNFRPAVGPLLRGGPAAAGFAQLIFLDLSLNQLVSLSPKDLGELPNLGVLYAHGNRFPDVKSVAGIGGESESVFFISAAVPRRANHAVHKLLPPLRVVSVPGAAVLAAGQAACALQLTSSARAQSRPACSFAP
eukprot:SAG22_NODE_1666_length_3859_cov_292.311702_5_plen_155_part_00